MKKKSKFFKPKSIKSFFLVLFSLFLTVSSVKAETHKYSDSWDKQGFTIKKSNANKVEINYSVNEFELSKVKINGENMQNLELPGNFLPGQEGAPNLPGGGRYIAIPQGATVTYKIVDSRIEKYSNVNLAPAPHIPFVVEDGDLTYKKDMSIYSKDAFYPEKPVILSEKTKIRGVDAVMLGVTPFQYNPVTKELLVYKDIKIEINFKGGNSHFGEDRLRSRSWDPILKDIFLNSSSLPKVEYKIPENTKTQGCEYLIIIPDDPLFFAWADSLKVFRNKQGISTEITTITQIGGNDESLIEQYVNNAYNTWDIPPSAILLLADYGNSGNTITTYSLPHPYGGADHYISDNIYADVNGNHLPDIAFSRITARDITELEVMVGKILNYERNPPISIDFYKHPLVAGGWQTERWFILCSEVVQGFWENELYKEPERQYSIYQGTPGSTWSTASNTNTVVNYWSNLGYIPSTPAYLNNWSGSASGINTAINSGAFMVLHRDHGMYTGWGEPNYTNSDLSGLDNENLTFVISGNCQTGCFDYSGSNGNCFVEAFHRQPKRALGLIGATEVSYSFVNDTYVWGVMDNMWSNFDPGYGTTNNYDDIRPCFANASGKYYLEASGWPSNPNNKEITFNLFHHHGGSYSTVYSSMPIALTVEHENTIPCGATSFTVKADNHSLICLSVDGNIIGVAEGTGSPVAIDIIPQNSGDFIELTITKQNCLRYHKNIPITFAPNQVKNPNPMIGQTKVSPFTTLNWEKGPGTDPDNYTFYFGTDNPPTNIENGITLTDTFYIPSSALEYNTEYFWKVDAHNQYGDAIGNLWNFTVIYSPDEDFETGSFSANNWYFNGDADWIIDNTVNFNGNYSSKSGSINDNQSTSLIIDCQTNTFNNVSFYKKVSSEENNDKLIFMIDGNVKGEWSGEIDWSFEKFAVGPGSHNLEWKYIKDAANSSGSDCAWLDDIYLCIDEHVLTANAGDDDTICQGSDYTLSGNAAKYSSIEWSTSGDGSFDNNTILTPVYTPGNNDIEIGNVVLTLTANDSQSNSISDDMNLAIYKAAYAFAGDDALVCQGSNYSLTDAQADNYNEILWTSDGDGSFDDNSIVNPVYTPGINDINSGEVTLTLNAIANVPCADVSDNILLTIELLPLIPDTPVGPDTVDLAYTPNSEYIISDNANATSYLWDLTPVEAGTINAVDTVATVLWDGGFLGDAFIKVKSINDCGESEFTEPITVVVKNTVGIQEAKNLYVQIFPNPNTGIFTLKFVTPDNDIININIYNSLGVSVYNENNLHLNGIFNKSININNYTDGVYYLSIKGKDTNIIKKIIVNK
ncbi:MAG: T9SS type A sorting domain-containing protein [Bacteroidales bacterium]|nr:T9SS type A sorting domain-containing protein [Bacteroidales bacterium]